MSKKQKLSFDEYFQEIYQSRWDSLKSSLSEHNSQVIRPCFSNYELEKLKAYDSSNKEGLDELNEQGLRKNYIMDLASIVAAKNLPIEPDDFVLDMCSAPGGKSLILLEQLSSGELWCNEISANRRDKLKSVIQNYVPKEFREKVFIKGKDGTRYGINFADTFDKILVDAPCSGEKHILNSTTELARWSPKRTKRLAKTQYSLLCSAILACKPQGQIVYSTCSISPVENDEVIKRALDKKADFIQLDLPEIDIANIERTDFGYIFLPDKSEYGPLYFSRLKKR